MRRAIPRAQNLHFATVSCERVHPAKSKCAFRYSGVTQKCVSPAHDVRGNPRHTKITILPQFRTSDQHEVTRRLRRPLQNLHVTTVLDVRRARSDERVARGPRQIRISPQFWTSDEHEVMRGLRRRRENLYFTTVLDVRQARSDERVASAK